MRAAPAGRAARRPCPPGVCEGVGPSLSRAPGHSCHGPGQRSAVPMAQGWSLLMWCRPRQPEVGLRLACAVAGSSGRGHERDLASPVTPQLSPAALGRGWDPGGRRIGEGRTSAPVSEGRRATQGAQPLTGREMGPDRRQLSPWGHGISRSPALCQRQLRPALTATRLDSEGAWEGKEDRAQALLQVDKGQATTGTK